MTKIISDYPEARSLLRRIAEYQQKISTYDYLRDEYLSQYGRDRASLSAASDDLGAYAPGNYLTMLNFSIPSISSSDRRRVFLA